MGKVANHVIGKAKNCLLRNGKEKDFVCILFVRLHHRNSNPTTHSRSNTTWRMIHTRLRSFGIQPKVIRRRFLRRSEDNQRTKNALCYLASLGFDTLHLREPTNWTWWCSWDSQLRKRQRAFCIDRGVLGTSLRMILHQRPCDSFCFRSFDFWEKDHTVLLW